MRCSDILVSVVIPTRNRPELVGRAVRSATQQTLEAIEVIVVVDGPDEATVNALRKVGDPRLKVVVLGSPLGGSVARNAGVNQANGRWIAFLDDDDEWMPVKLERQLRTAEASAHRYPIVSCHVIARTEAADFVWPRRLPREGEPLSEYLFCRTTPFSGEGIVQTSTVFVAKGLMEKVPFPADVPPHEDIGWLLRAVRVEGVAVEFVADPQPLVIWHIEESRERVSHTSDWRRSLNWVRASHELVTRRASASFLMTTVSQAAAQAGHWKAFWVLIWELRRHGNPGIMSFLAHLANWLAPTGFKQWAASRFERSGHGKGQN